MKLCNNHTLEYHAVLTKPTTKMGAPILCLPVPGSGDTVRTGQTGRPTHSVELTVHISGGGLPLHAAPFPAAPRLPPSPRPQGTGDQTNIGLPLFLPQSWTSRRPGPLMAVTHSPADARLPPGTV